MAALFKLIAALAFVIALMLAFAYIVKRWGVAQMKMQGKDSRLKVIENIPIDARHRAVLLQRDDVQHLVICGASSETVVETGIKPVQSDDHDA